MRLTILSLSLLALPLVASTLPLPDGLKTQWDAVPVVEEGGQRGHQVINGLWRFKPGDPEKPAAGPPADAWSHVWVPGSWHTRPGWNELGIVAYGDTPLWKKFDQQHRKWPIGWYEREVTIPASWKDRRVFVDFSELSTRAQVWLDEVLCGTLENTSGQVELTKAIKPGQPQLLRIKVFAVPPSEPSLLLMGEMAEQVILKPGKLNKFGLVWDVRLVSEPKGAVLDPPLITTSVSQKKLSIRSALAGAKAKGPVKVGVTVRDLEGNVLKAWEEKEVSLDKNGAFEWEESWLPERLWDIDDPFLMRAEVKVTGDGISNQRFAQFGFREFDIRGKEFFLNGSRVRMRTLPDIDMPILKGMVDNLMKGKKSIGVNMKMVHANQGHELTIDAADRLGILVFAELPEIKEYAFKGTWKDNREDWERRMKEVIAKYYNHPSIVMWWTGFNVFAHGEDQNPARLGKIDELTIENEAWEKRVEVGLEAMDLIRKADPTRGVYSHNASIVGDIQTTNTYLCLIPLQEREEWLSEWAENGEIPFLACEFGTPLNNTFMQGKQGGGWTTIGRPNAQGSANSAKMLTEYAAIYLGDEAYKKQPKSYAKAVKESHVDGFVHTNVHFRGGKPTPLQELHRSEAFQELHSLFLRNSLRSWRTWGLTAGMNLWSVTMQSHLLDSWRINSDNIPLGEFKPGTPGGYRPEIYKGLYYNYLDGGWERLKSADAWIDNFGDVLAWIAGDQDQGFTDKDHHFVPGEVVNKQVALINDKRDATSFKGTWSAKIGGKQIASGDFEQSVEPGLNGMQPFQFEIPKEISQRVDGEITLQVQAAGETLEDAFPFRVYPLVQSKVQEIALLPGDGKTKAMLKALGVKTVNWSKDSKLPLIVGRGGLERANMSELSAWVNEGGRLLLSSPSPEWLADQVGFRVTPHPSRRAYPTAQAHAVSNGIDRHDLRDWNATSTLVEGYPKYSSKLKISGDKPYHGWRWGNRGSVASVMVEKPHHGAWRPILEGEFDLAYSPLMELDYGSGLVVLSTLDLEDNVPVDPAATQLAAQLVDYLGDWKSTSAPRKPVAYAGEEKWDYILNAMGVELTEERQQAQLLILGKDHGVNGGELKDWLEQGKNVLLLHGAELPDFTGWTWGDVRDFYGTTKVPTWPEAAGLSISDFHLRAPYPMPQLRGQGVEAEGMLARKEVGQGVIMAMAMDPTWIRADQQPFMRLTVWRQSRVLTQLIAALGGELTLDRQIFDQETLPTGQKLLAGDWEAKAISLLPTAPNIKKPHADPGMSQEARDAVAQLEGGEGWKTYAIPAPVETADAAWAKKDGEFVFRKVVDVPKDWAGKKLLLELDRVDDYDTTYWNGEKIGAIGSEHPTPWSAKRLYAIPGDQVKEGKNTISIRTWDRFGDGGLMGHKEYFRLQLTGARQLDWYHPDYRRDFAYGDDPYRYYRW